MVTRRGAAIVADINTAHTSLDFTSEELADIKVIDALAAAARRGVACRIVMTDSPNWTAGFTQVIAAGCTVHAYPNTTKALYIHEKIIAVDQFKVLIGSQNASSTSLNRNRELSIQITAAPIVSTIEQPFTSDHAAAPAWTPKSVVPVSTAVSLADHVSGPVAIAAAAVVGVALVFILVIWLARTVLHKVVGVAVSAGAAVATHAGVQI